MLKSTMRVSGNVAGVPSATQDSFRVLRYSYVADVLEKRQPHRSGHLQLLKTFFQPDELLLGGAFANPPDGAMLVFRNVSKERIERFVSQDPYVRNDLVTHWDIRDWSCVVGSVLDVGVGVGGPGGKENEKKK
ncbi:unnamed protein product [Vitrella brassicaformis CCMP3155]|uniref:YCII-related domain-containing protein n=1 Tax=Vitrella brassicaformis (strain CCMP3155) TaxID=1169540 RepID=A0A0G4ERK1_VITBC|nr:unnamed protein product [Vitrella brassicaformis CCMP3155]|eukprot:CEM00659.1 unnamed protein product [Vitrella brassicaformis CCMP3155]